MRLRPEGPCLGAAGPDADVVVSSRLRVARNLAAFPFVARATDSQRREVVQSVIRAGASPGSGAEMVWVDMAKATTVDRQLLVERHLVSRPFADAEHPRAVGIAADETLSVMVNEEDHLRIQALLPGAQLEEAFQSAMRFDSELGERVDFAFNRRWGYLTACPTNVGCGIRLSVMLHLPALKLTGELERVKRAAKDLNLAVRGFYGEHSEAIGSFFQISNQVTLGVREEELLSAFTERVVPPMVTYEREARAMLLERSRLVVEDKVFRAIGTLHGARLLTAEEATKLLSSVRLGVALGLVHGWDLAPVSRLMLQTQPAHLAAAAPAASDEQAAKSIRASVIHRHLPLLGERRGG